MNDDDDGSDMLNEILLIMLMMHVNGPFRMGRCIPGYREKKKQLSKR